MKAFKWLYPGMKVKRWIALVFLGILLLSTRYGHRVGSWVCQCLRAEHCPGIPSVG